MSRPTSLQQEALADFLEQNPGIAKGLLRTANAKQNTKKKWHELSLNLNALGGAQKDGKGWAKYWADKKCALKRICAQKAQSLSRTGGGSVEALPSLTPIDQRLVAVMGGPRFAIGDSHVAINPFPESPAVQNIEIVETPSLEIIPMVEENHGNDERALEPGSNSAVHNADSVTVNMVPHASQHESSMRPPRASRTRSRTRPSNMYQQDRQMFVDIERQRVEAETLTARALSEAVGNIADIATAINNLAQAITGAAQVIALAINNANAQ